MIENDSNWVNLTLWV